MRNIDETKRYQPIKNAAALMGVSDKWLYDQCRNGKVPHVRMGRDYRVDMDAWNDMLARESAASLKQNGAE